MDFRTIDPASLDWAPGFGSTAARVKPSPTIQTPRCPARLVETAPGRTRVELSLGRCEGGLFEPFAAWCEALEAAAAPLASGGGSKAAFASVLRSNGGSMRVTAFDECEWFDDTGAFLAPGPEAARVRAAAGEASCVLTLTGAWASEARWGLRWKVVQVKLFPAAAEDAPRSGAGNSSKPGGASKGGGAYAFLD